MFFTWPELIFLVFFFKRNNLNTKYFHCVLFVIILQGIKIYIYILTKLRIEFY